MKRQNNKKCLFSKTDKHDMIKSHHRHFFDVQQNKCKENKSLLAYTEQETVAQWQALLR